MIAGDRRTQTRNILQNLSEMLQMNFVILAKTSTARARAQRMIENCDYDHHLRDSSKYFMNKRGCKLNSGISSWSWKSAQNVDLQPETHQISQFPENRQLARPAPELLLTSTAKAWMLNESFDHCGWPQDSDTKYPSKLIRNAPKHQNYDFHDFHVFLMSNWDFASS